MNVAQVEHVSDGVMWVSGASVIKKIVALAYIYVVLNALSLHEYGVVELALTIPPLMGILLLPGLQDSVQADVGAAKSRGALGRARQILVNFIRFRLLLSIMPFLLLLGGSYLIADYYHENIVLLLQILSISFLIGPLRSAAHIVLYVHKDFQILSVLSVVEEVVKLFVVAILLFYFDLGMVALIVGYVVAEAVLPILGAAKVFLHMHAFSNHTDTVTPRPVYESFLAHGKWSALLRYLNIMGSNLRLWFIQVFLGTEAVALFGVAFGFLQHLTNLVPLHTVTAPFIYELVDRKKKLAAFGRTVIKYHLIAYVVLGTLAFFAAPYVFTTLFPQYTDAIPLFQALLFVLIPSAFSGTLTNIFVLMQKQRSLVFATLKRSMTVLLLAPFFLYFFGIYGAVIEVTVGYSLFVLDRYRLASRLLPAFTIRLRDLVVFSTRDKVFIAALLRRYKGKVAQLLHIG